MNGKPPPDLFTRRRKNTNQSHRNVVQIADLFIMQTVNILTVHPEDHSCCLILAAIFSGGGCLHPTDR